MRDWWFRAKRERAHAAVAETIQDPDAAALWAAVPAPHRTTDDHHPIRHPVALALTPLLRDCPAIDRMLGRLIRAVDDATALYRETPSPSGSTLRKLAVLRDMLVSAERAARLR